MKIAIAQMRVQANQPQKNFEAMKAIVKEYESSVDLIVFPEMCISGYYVGDRFLKEDFVNEMTHYNIEIKLLSQNTGIIWGNLYHENHKNYNAAFFAAKGEWVGRDSKKESGVYKKHLLPNYTLFDDKRYFHAGEGLFEPFEYMGKKLSIQICEDMWDDRHDFSPTDKMMTYQPDMMVNISCSPWTLRKEGKRLEQIDTLNLDIPFIYVNAVGMQNNGKNVVLFDGGSMVKQGDIVTMLADNFESEVLVVETTRLHHKPFEKNDDKIHDAMIKAIQYFDEETLPYKPNWIVGVSGGLDSSVSVSLLVEALGSNRIIGVTMPSNFSREITKNNAYHLSKKLGIRFLEIPIGGMVDATVGALNLSGYNSVQGLAYENIQARLRGHTLMSLSSLENGVIMNNGNKIEVALGYATLYGDAIGALAILGDLTKMQVGTLAQSINRRAQTEIVPINLIPIQSKTKIDWDFAPSAELAQDQFDPMKWGYHDALITYLMKYSLIDLLESYQDKTIYDTELGGYLNAYHLDQGSAFIEDLNWVLKTMNTAVYKRIQMPPIVTVSEYAFGLAYRESQSAFRVSEHAQVLMQQIAKETISN